MHACSVIAHVADAVRVNEFVFVLVARTLISSKTFGGTPTVPDGYRCVPSKACFANQSSPRYHRLSQVFSEQMTSVNDQRASLQANQWRK